MTKASLFQDDAQQLSQLSSQAQNETVDHLESGRIAYLPHFTLNLSNNEMAILDPKVLSPKSKNISYQYWDHRVKNYQCTEDKAKTIADLCCRFSVFAQQLVATLLPYYQSHIRLGRTSFRPVEIEGRGHKSVHQDDTKLHVDAFPSRPMQGDRLLRVFTNIHPNGRPRQWRVGEAFPQLVATFKDQLPSYRPWVASLLALSGLTRPKRTAYDHHMLQLHHIMKQDQAYQRRAIHDQIDFPSGSTWIVMTDVVSHAALSGQHILEQTFYLPYQAMKDPEKAPVRVLENALGHKLL